MTTNVSVIQSNPNPNPNRETNTIFARSFKQLQAAGGDILYLAGNLKFLREQIGKTQQEFSNLKMNNLLLHKKALFVLSHI